MKTAFTTELNPCKVNQQSFYGKAKVQHIYLNNTITVADTTYAAGTYITLFSYNTPIITAYTDINGNSTLIRHWIGWSATTGRHIREFCNLNKAEYTKLSYQAYNDFLYFYCSLCEASKNV